MARTPSNILFSSRAVHDTPMKEGHRLHGIFAASGRGIRSGAVLENARIEDIAPTILYYMGHGIPSDMEGRLVESLFTPEHLVSHEVRFFVIAECKTFYAQHIIQIQF